MINYVRRCDALAQRLPHKRSAEDFSEQGVTEAPRRPADEYLSQRLPS